MGLGNVMNESKLALSGLPSCLLHTPPLLVFLPGSGCCLLNMSVATTHGKLGFCCFVRLLQPGNVFGLQDVDGEL